MSALRSVSLLLIAVLSLASTRVSAYSTSVWWNSQTCAGEPDQYISGQINNNCAQKDGKSVGITCQDTLKITQYYTDADCTTKDANHFVKETAGTCTKQGGAGSYLIDCNSALSTRSVSIGAMLLIAALAALTQRMA